SGMMYVKKKPPGVLISFEGLDGVGKSTQIARVAQWLKSHGIMDPVVIREPGGTPLGEALRDMVIKEVQAHSALAELMVFAAARAELVDTVIAPALRAGRVVLADRFIDSSVAYQGYGRGLAIETVQTVNRLAVREYVPDMTIWLKGRSFLGAGSTRDLIEQRSADFFARVEHGYRCLAQKDAARWRIIEANQPPCRVFEQIVAQIAARITV
ncbi:MAG: dTMP kinase, partial [Firmicutes bacterium]|nr:dTMP kinase [Bacillota bacterium]